MELQKGPSSESFNTGDILDVKLYPSNRGLGVEISAGAAANTNQQSWRRQVLRQVRQGRQETKDKFHPSVQRLRALVENQPEVQELFVLMIEQVPLNYGDEMSNFKDWHELLEVLNYLLTQPPPWSSSEHVINGVVGVPINALLNWLMATDAGMTAFHRSDVNDCLRDVLNAYGLYLQSAGSTKALSDAEGGWFTDTGLKALCQEADPSSEHPRKFEELFGCDVSQPHYGFTSWDDFFVRQFRPGVRPTAHPDDDTVIVSVCESRPLTLAHGAKLHDDFWLKGQPYSLADMLGGEQYAKAFAGGTVYHAFLSPLSYHRWHAPVSGTVHKVVRIPGTYFAQNRYNGFDSGDPDPCAPQKSQRYISHIATRSIMFLDADNQDIGIMAIVLVGMAEVSSCEWLVGEGAHVMKGQEIGMFHFGGSTHCLVFRPEVDLEFVQHAMVSDPYGEGPNMPVCGQLAVVRGVNNCK